MQCDISGKLCLIVDYSHSYLSLYFTPCTLLLRYSSLSNVSIVYSKTCIKEKSLAMLTTSTKASNGSRISFSSPIRCKTPKWPAPVFFNSPERVPINIGTLRYGVKYYYLGTCLRVNGKTSSRLRNSPLSTRAIEVVSTHPPSLSK